MVTVDGASITNFIIVDSKVFGGRAEIPGVRHRFIETDSMTRASPSENDSNKEKRKQKEGRSGE